MRHEPDGPVEVPERVTVYRTIVYDDEKCLGCGTCARGCPAEAIEARPPQADAAPAPCRPRRRAAERHDRLERQRPGAPARAPLRVRRHAQEHRLRPARAARGPARRRDARRPLVQPRGPGAAPRADGGRRGRQLVFAGCSQDFAARRLQKLFARGLQLEIADIREGCSWVHGDDVAAVTDKAMRIVASSIAYPDAPADTMSYAERHDTVVVIGGGVAGTQAAAELAQMGHQVELIERRPFLGGRAARIGTVFPTNDCGQCLPATDAQAGTRKCFHRNVAIDHPDLTIRRRSTVESRHRAPRRLRGERPPPAQHRHRRLHQLRHLRDGLRGRVVGARQEGHLHRVLRRPRGAHHRPRHLHLLRQVRRGVPRRGDRLRAVAGAHQDPRRRHPHGHRLRAGAPKYYSEFLPDHEGVVTQVELAEMLDDWAAQASLGRMPVKELVMIQCAGSRDKRHLPHCSRLCCMIALKHAIRLKTLFPEMKITICYLEMRTAGVGYENWFLDARKAGVEFLRGTPPEVQFDAAGRPVIEVEDVTAARKRVLRPDLVVLSTGMVPAAETERLAQTLGVDRDDDGFIEILDRKNRATETSGEGIFVCGSAAGPKALIEVNTEASAVASEIHNFLTSAGRRGTAPSRVDAAQCVGCDTCTTMCPFGAITLEDRPADAARPAEVKDDGKLAVIDAEICRACGICAANCPEVAIAHNLSDDALFGRIALMTEGVERAGRRLLLQGVRRRRHRPERPAARPLPRERAAHRAAMPGPRQRAAHRGGGPPGRRRRVSRRLRRGPLPVPHRRHQRARTDADRRGSAGRAAARPCRSSSGTSAPSTA